MRARRAGACLLVVLATGCVRRIPEPAGGRTNAPRVGWVMMSGDAENPDRDFVCQSNPPSECVVPADRPEARVLAHVHMYYHSSSMEMRYTGAIRIGFFNQPREIKPSITVKAGDRAGNQSVSDFVTSKPGTYPLTIAVVATSTQTGEERNIRDEVRVSVK